MKRYWKFKSKKCTPWWCIFQLSFKFRFWPFEKLKYPSVWMNSFKSAYLTTLIDLNTVTILHVSFFCVCVCTHVYWKCQHSNIFFSFLFKNERNRKKCCTKFNVKFMWKLCKMGMCVRWFEHFTGEMFKK